MPSNCTPLPDHLSGRARWRFLQNEMTREQQASGGDIHAGLFSGEGGRTLLVMASSPGIPLGPSVCHHYRGQGDFLWLEHSDRGWTWCLIRMNVPVAEGVDSPRQDVEQVLRRQQGNLTVNSPDRKVQDWLTSVSPPGLTLQWIWLETAARQSLRPQVRLQSPAALIHRLQLAFWTRAGVLGLAPVALVTGFWFWQSSGFKAAPVDELPPPVAKQLQTDRPALPLTTTLRQVYRVLISLWARGAGEVRLRMVASTPPGIELQLTGTHPSALSAIAHWAGRHRVNIERDDDELTLRLPPDVAGRTGADADSDSEIFRENHSHPAWLLWYTQDRAEDALLTSLELTADSHWRIRKMSGTIAATDGNRD